MSKHTKDRRAVADGLRALADHIDQTETPFSVHYYVYVHAASTPEAVATARQQVAQFLDGADYEDFDVQVAHGREEVVRRFGAITAHLTVPLGVLGRDEERTETHTVYVAPVKDEVSRLEVAR